MKRGKYISLCWEKVKYIIIQAVELSRNLLDLVVNRLTILVDRLLIFKNGGKLKIRRLSLIRPVPQVGGKAQLLLDLKNCYAVEVNGTRLSGRTKKMHLAISEGKNEINVVCYGKDELLRKIFTFTGLHFKVAVPDSPLAIMIPNSSMNQKTIVNPIAKLRTVTAVSKKINSIESLKVEKKISIPSSTSPIIPTFKREKYL